MEWWITFLTWLGSFAVVVSICFVLPVAFILVIYKLIINHLIKPSEEREVKWTEKKYGKGTSEGMSLYNNISEHFYSRYEGDIIIIDPKKETALFDPIGFGISSSEMIENAYKKFPDKTISFEEFQNIVETKFGLICDYIKIKKEDPKNEKTFYEFEKFLEEIADGSLIKKRKKAAAKIKEKEG